MEKTIRRELENLLRAAEASPLHQSRKWITSPDEKIQIYIRITKRMSGMNKQRIPVLDIANISVAEKFKREGIFTKALRILEKIAFENNRSVYIEQVLELWFKEWLMRKQGYEEYPPDKNCLIKHPPWGVEMEKERPNWDEYFMKFATLASSRTTCLRRTVGAVLVREKQILATGYNGAPRGIKHCSETGCIRQQRNTPSGERQELCRALHAEHNAFLQAAREGISVKGSTLYCTNQPCGLCARMIIQVGVVTVYYKEEYSDGLAEAMLTEAGIPMIKLK